MPTHSFETGQTVTVINNTLSGKFIIEGEGQIVSPIYDASDEWYMVRFHDGEWERFVDPQAQDDPQKFIDEMNALRVNQ